MRVSSSAAPATRSDMPVPRLSKKIRRAKEADPFEERAHVRAPPTPNSTCETKPRDVDEVERAVADDLVRDADVAAARVARLRRHRREDRPGRARKPSPCRAASGRRSCAPSCRAASRRRGRSAAPARAGSTRSSGASAPSRSASSSGPSSTSGGTAATSAAGSGKASTGSSGMRSTPSRSRLPCSARSS